MKKSIEIKEMGVDPLTGIDYYAVINPETGESLGEIDALEYLTIVPLIRNISSVAQLTVRET